jgi:hypothetical protein
MGDVVDGVLDANIPAEKELLHLNDENIWA